MVGKLWETLGTGGGVLEMLLGDLLIFYFVDAFFYVHVVIYEGWRQLLLLLLKILQPPLYPPFDLLLAVPQLELPVTRVVIYLLLQCPDQLAQFLELVADLDNVEGHRHEVSTAVVSAIVGSFEYAFLQ